MDSGQGFYYFGPEVDAFKPCDSPESFWFSHGWCSIHADGFVADYDGIIHVSAVTKLAAVLSAVLSAGCK